MWLDGRDREPTEPAARTDAAVDLLENVLRAWPRWRDAWRTRLAHASPPGGAFSGAPAKQGGTFLNHPDALRDLVSAVVDINPRRQDRFIAGTGQPIVAPAALAGPPVATLLLANSIYAGEIELPLRELGCDVLVVLLEPAA